MILVTGGTGMVGAHLILHLLEQGYSLTATFRTLESKTKCLNIIKLYKDEKEAVRLFAKITWVKADILDYDGLRDVITKGMQVYNCAAMVSFSPKDAAQILKYNIEGTTNLVNACLEKEIKKLVHVSSIAAIGTPTEVAKEIDEDLEERPHPRSSAYSISKFRSEMEVWRGISEGLNAVIVNPSVILGPGDWTHGSPRIISSVAKGMRFSTPGVTGYVDVLDVAKCMQQLMDSSISAHRFVLSAENKSFTQIFTTTAQFLKLNPPKKELKPWMLKCLVPLEQLRAFLTAKPARINFRTVKSAFRKQYYNGKKIHSFLPFQYTPISTCLERVCKHYTLNSKTN